MVAIFGLGIWVAIAALAAALVSATQVITKEVVVPWRKKVAGNTVACLRCSGFTGTAFQIAPKRWVTASHLLREKRAPSAQGIEPELKIGDSWVSASLVYRDESLDLAVLAVQTEWPWSAKVSWSLPEQGSVVDVTGYTWGGQRPDGRDRDVRVTQQYTIQGPPEDTLIVLTGAVPPAGFSGSPVTDTASGRVLAVLQSTFSSGNKDGHGPQNIDQVHAIPLACIPAQHRP
ncbi:S1 family peptidase [Streptomyces phaeochromogenes]